MATTAIKMNNFQQNPQKVEIIHCKIVSNCSGLSCAFDIKIDGFVRASKREQRAAFGHANVVLRSVAVGVAVIY
jgi:hypothetical protein